ncbi:MAG: hypothetical protein ACE5JU_25790, partial [Candidatus Binatia bacterium]
AALLAKESLFQDLVIPEPVANQILGWNASGNNLALFTLGASQILNVMTSKGDLIQSGNASGDAERLAVGATGALLNVAAGKAAWLTVGADGKVLQVVSGVPSWEDAAFAVGAGYQNLRVRSGATVATMVSGTCDELEVYSTDNPSTRTRKLLKNLTWTDVSMGATLSATVDGKSSDVEGANEFWSLWVLYNPTTAVTRYGLFLNATTHASVVTRITGFTHARKIAIMRNDGSLNFLEFEQTDNVTEYTDAFAALTLADNATFTNLDLTAEVPSAEATHVLATIRLTSNNLVGLTGIFVRRDGKTGSTGYEVASVQQAATSMSLSLPEIAVAAGIYEYRMQPNVGASTTREHRTRGFKWQI